MEFPLFVRSLVVVYLIKIVVMKFVNRIDPVCPSRNFANDTVEFLKTLTLFQPSLISENLTKTLVDGDGCEIQSISSDIEILLAMQRGTKVDEALASEILARMSKQTDTIQELFDQASDEDLLSSIKSRYIQTPAELEQYIDYLESQGAPVPEEIQESVSDSSIEEPIAESSSE